MLFSPLLTKPTIEVTEGVYPPSEDSDLLLSSMIVRSGETVLDMGTGSGILAIAAALRGGIVTAVDIAEDAVACARMNAGLNGVDPSTIRFVRSDLFSHPDIAGGRAGRFDVILFNPPYLPTEEWSGQNRGGGDHGDMTWDGGGDGAETIRRFLDQLPDHLGKRCYLLFSSLSGEGRRTIEPLLRGRLLFHEVARKQLFFETLFVYELLPPAPPHPPCPV